MSIQRDLNDQISAVGWCGHATAIPCKIFVCSMEVLGRAQPQGRKTVIGFVLLRPIWALELLGAVLSFLSFLSGALSSCCSCWSIWIGVVFVVFVYLWICEALHDSSFAGKTIGRCCREARLCPTSAATPVPGGRNAQAPKKKLKKSRSIYRRNPTAKGYTAAVQPLREFTRY
jgi:hypothetical protein